MDRPIMRSAGVLATVLAPGLLAAAVQWLRRMGLLPSAASTERRVPHNRVASCAREYNPIYPINHLSDVPLPPQHRPIRPIPLPPSLAKTGSIFVFGLGFTGSRVAQRLVAAGWTVYGTTRSVDSAARLRASGVNAFVFDSILGDDQPSVEGIVTALLSCGHVLITAAPGTRGDPVLMCTPVVEALTAPDRRVALALGDTPGSNK